MIGRKKVGQRLTKMMLFVLLITTIIQMNTFAMGSTDKSISLQMDSTKLQMGVGTSMSLVLRNVDGQAKIIDFKGIENFKILSQSQSQSTSSINGQVIKEIRVDYMIMPQNIGDYELQAVLKIKGKEYVTNTLFIKVTGQDTSLSQINEDIFLKTTISKKQFYFGENTVVTYDLYSRYQVDQFGFTEPIEEEGFIIEESENSNQSQSFIMIGNKKYAKYRAKQMVISPMDIGEFTLPVFDFQVNVSTGNFFGETKPIYLQSESVDFKVLPLPSEDQPKMFNGLTGEISLEYTYDMDEVSINAPLTLNVTVSGEGNLYLLDSIADHMNLNDFTVYETEKASQDMISEEGRTSHKSFELILIPKKSGTLTIPKMNLPYFDTKSKTYKDLVIDKKRIVVTGKTTGSQESILNQGIHVQEPKEVIVINQVTYSDDKEGYYVFTFKKIVFKICGLVLLAIVFFIGIFYYDKRIGKTKIKYLKALKITKDEGEIYDLFAKYMQETYGVSIKSLTLKQMHLIFKEHKELDKLIKLLEYFNEDRYHKQLPLESLKKELKIIIKSRK